MATARNVYKEETKIITLPKDPLSNGLSNECKVPFPVLATLSDNASHKNDKTSVALICDTLTVELEKEDGTLIPAVGLEISFPYQSDAKGFCIDWRQVTKNAGTEIANGCYKVKCSYNVSGIDGVIYKGTYNLLEYSDERAEGTARLYVVLNDYVRKDGINYRESGFASTFRFKGMFGFMQPNYDSENIILGNRVREKVRNEALRTYELRTDYVNGCFTEQIDFEYLLKANQIYVTDHNTNNHIKKYIDFPVILDEEQSPSLEYNEGEKAKLTAFFLDKKAVHESKYDGEIQGTENIILELPQLVSQSGGCPDATLTLNSNSFTTAPSGSTTDIELIDQDDNDITPISVIGNTIKVEVPEIPPVWADMFEGRVLSEGGTFEDKANLITEFENNFDLYDNASLAITPNGYKANKLFSFKPFDGSGDLDFSRNSAATRINESGLIESLAANVPRLNYPIGGGNPSWLFEDETTNIALHTEDFSNGVYVRSNGNITVDSSVSPDGNTTADTLVQNASVVMQVTQTVTVADDSQRMYASLFVKKEVSDNFLILGMRFIGGSTLIGTSIQINKRTGDFFGGLALGGGYTVPEEINVFDYVDYWRIYIAISNNSTGNTSLQTVIQPNRGTSLNNFTQVDGDAVCWGLNITSLIGSYVPAGASTVTSLKDSTTPIPNNGLISDVSGSIRITSREFYNDVVNTIFSAYTDSNNLISVYYDASNTINVEFKVGGTSVVSSNTVSDTTILTDIRVEYTVTGFEVFINDVSVDTQAITGIAAMTDLHLGDGTNDFIGELKVLIID